jgi:hypothetical protein
MCGHIRKDRIRNEVIHDRLGLAPIDKKLVQHDRIGGLGMSNEGLQKLELIVDSKEYGGN